MDGTDVRAGEVWAVSIDEARGFFDGLPDVCSLGTDRYSCGTGEIRLEEAPALELCGKKIRRVRLNVRGDAEVLLRAFRLRFLRAGG